LAACGERCNRTAPRTGDNRPADGLVAAGYSPAESRARASLYVGALRGLLLDLLATGDRGRLEAAVGLLGTAVERDLATMRKRRREPSRGRARATVALVRRAAPATAGSGSHGRGRA
jgi:hypothetical protein